MSAYTRSENLKKKQSSLLSHIFILFYIMGYVMQHYYEINTSVFDYLQILHR